MAACSSSTSIPVCPTPASTPGTTAKPSTDIFKAIDATLGLLPTLQPRSGLVPPCIAGYADRASVTGRIHKLFAPYLNYIFSYALSRPQYVFIEPNNIFFSPGRFKNLPCAVHICFPGELHVPLHTEITKCERKHPKHYNVTIPFPPSVAAGLGAPPVFPLIPWPVPVEALSENPEGQAALYEKIQAVLAPHLEAIAEYTQQLLHRAYSNRNYGEEVQLLPSGLLLDNAQFEHLSHSVVVRPDKQFSILTEHLIENRKKPMTPYQELLRPPEIQGILNEINALLHKQASLKDKEEMPAKFPVDTVLQPEAIEKVRALVTPRLTTLFQDLAKKISYGMRFSRKMYNDLPYSLCLLPSGVMTVHTSILKGCGTYRKVKLLFDLFSPARYVISSPSDPHIDFFKEIVQEQRLARLNGKPGFLKYEAYHAEDSCRLLTKPPGLIANECHGDIRGFHSHLKTIQKQEERDRLLFVFINSLLNALETLHEADIFHLDLTIKNILSSTEGEVTLIDFGLSHDPLHLEKLYYGAPYIVPPEINLLCLSPIADKIFSIIKSLKKPSCSSDPIEWNGQQYSTDQMEQLQADITKDVCRAYDIWSLGICLFVLITGKPYHEMSCNVLQRANLLRELRESKSIYAYLGTTREACEDNPLLQWVLKMLVLEPSERPTLAELRKTLPMPQI